MRPAMPNIVDLTSEEDISPSESQTGYSKSLLEQELQLAKEHGVCLSLSEDHKLSPSRRQLIVQFLRDLTKLQKAEAGADADTGPVATRNAVEDPLQPEEDEKDEEDFNNFDAEIFDAEKSEPIAAKVPTMKRKGFSLNSVCSNCKQQYNEDDNPDGCCTYHRGSMEPVWTHDHWADAFPEMDDTYYSDEDWDPDAWSWTCCDGNAKAEPCYEGPHRKQSNKRNKQQ